MFRNLLFLFCVFLMSFGTPGWAADVGEEVEVSSGAITALSCAMEAQRTGKLDPISNCSMSDTVAGLAVYDLALKDIYLLSPSSVHLYELERAFGGGRIDFVGTVLKQSDGIDVVSLSEYSISPRPKAGAFKGCL